MNTKTVLNIFVPDSAWGNEYVEAMTLEARKKGVKGLVQDTGTIYPISMLGVNKITADHFAMLDSLSTLGVVCSGESTTLPCTYVGNRYAVIPESWIDNLVPVAFPLSKYTDENGDEVRRRWEEWAYKYYQLDTLEYLVLLNPYPQGGTAARGLTLAELLTVKEAIAPVEILTKAEGEALIPAQETEE